MHTVFTVQKSEMDFLFKAGNINPSSALAERIRKVFGSEKSAVVIFISQAMARDIAAIGAEA